MAEESGVPARLHRWADPVFGADLRSLGLFRIGLAAVLLWDLFDRSKSVAAHYTETGTIPASLGNLSHLFILDLSHNQLTGSIPPDLSRLDALEFLQLSENRLSGALPPDLAEMDRVRTLLLDGNQLTGPLPPAFSRSEATRSQPRNSGVSLTSSPQPS